MKQLLPHPGASVRDDDAKDYALVCSLLRMLKKKSTERSTMLKLLRYNDDAETLNAPTSAE